MGDARSSENSAVVLSLRSGLQKIPCTGKPSLFTIIFWVSLLTRNMYNSNSHYVAVKIKAAEASAKNSGKSILSYLGQQENPDPMSRHVITILDFFEHQGPNGKHACIVFEASSCSVSDLLRFTPEYFHSSVTTFPYSMAKRVLRQILMEFASCNHMASSTETFTRGTFYLQFLVLSHAPWRSWSKMNCGSSPGNQTGWNARQVGAPIYSVNLPADQTMVQWTWLYCQNRRSRWR